MSAPHCNRLAREKSPYLLQHAHNPVDWFPWGPEAFEKARRENKPIFLSIGYSTCHWCHVMERESFEDEQVAEFLNEHFVSIKVDREERPDVDRIYMAFVQATTGAGGWPMSVFLTPDLKPFYGGTYFPPDSRHGRPGFLQVLHHLAELWQRRREEIIAGAEKIHAQLKAAAEITAAEPGILTEAVLRHAADIFKQSFDPVHGGFGGAPKFPQPAVPQFLLRAAKRFRDGEAAQMVLFTCEKMAAGGIHDQLGGGFARYAVDAAWRVPHFEKMLYDNAQLAQLYLDAHSFAQSEISHPEPGIYSAVARDILDYVRRDLMHPDGGFFSAEDADSEGYEGKFYCWTRRELSELLSPEEFNVAVEFFGVTAEGNFVDHSHPQPLGGQNVLSVVRPDLSPAERPLLESARKKMLAARQKRIRPQRDDKVLASWNGLMLGAFARAGAALGEEQYLATAEKNFRFLRQNLWEDKSQTLFHRWCRGERDPVELLAGYAFCLSGVIEFYEATLNPALLDFALALAETMLARFYDAEEGGFWQSPPGATDLIVRMKDDYDGAEPSGNAVATLALLRLGAITGRKDFVVAAEKTLRFFAGRLQALPQALPFMLQALDFSLQEPVRLVVAGNRDSKKFRELLRAAHSVYQPNKVVLGNAGAVGEWTRSLPVGDEVTAYVCVGTACRPPTGDPEQLKAWLR